MIFFLNSAILSGLIMNTDVLILYKFCSCYLIVLKTIASNTYKSKIFSINTIQKSHPSPTTTHLIACILIF